MILQLRGNYYFRIARGMCLRLGCVFVCPEVDVVFGAYDMWKFTDIVKDIC